MDTVWSSRRLRVVLNLGLINYQLKAIYCVRFVGVLTSFSLPCKLSVKLSFSYNHEHGSHKINR